MAKRRKTSQVMEHGGDFLKKNKKRVAYLVLFCAVAATVGLWLSNFLHTAEFFNCGAIEIDKMSALEGPVPAKDFFKLSRKVNIFEADTCVLADKIKESHAEFRNVIITKHLPNRIVATIVDRQPVAVIKIGRICEVDGDGFVLPPAAQTDPTRLPNITGLESQLFSPSVGKKLQSRRLAMALDILQRLAEMREFKGSAIESVDVTYPDKMNFKMDGVTIVIGDAEFDKRIELLAKILSDSKIDKASIDSIDLRFTDVVINTKQPKR